MRFQRGSAMLFNFVMLAEMAEFPLSARMRSLFGHSDGCRDGGLCDFSASRQRFAMVVKMADLRFQRGCMKFVSENDGCGDGGICVFSSDAEFLFAF